MKPECETLFHFRIFLLGRKIWLEDTHNQAADKLTSASSHFTVEVSGNSSDSLLLPLMVENAISFLTSAKEPLE